MTLRLRVNDVITYNGAEMVILKLNHGHDQVLFFTPATTANSSMSIKELRRELAEGVATSSAPAAAHGLLQDFEKQSPAFSQFLFNDAVVKHIKKLTHSGKTVRQAIIVAIETGITLVTGEIMPMCSTTQAYRLLRASNDVPIAIMPNYSGRGNRTPRYGERMKEIALQEIEEHYAVKKSRITLPFLKEIVTRKARAEGILAVDQAVSKKYIKSILLGSWNPDRDYKRLDPRIAKSAKAVAKNRIVPGAPLNRVEIDGLHLPFLATNEERTKVLDDIWLLHAMDCDSSHPLGWWLTCARPTTDDTFSCLERAIFPKAELLKSMGVNFTVDPFGSIMNIVMDNGSENAKPRFACLTTIGSNPHWTAKDSGHEKPFIERGNGCLKVALEPLPGCTRFQGIDGKRTEEAMNDDLMTINELERWIVRWLFEVWPNKPLERFITADYEIDKSLGLTPAERWVNYERTQSLPLCPAREDWDRLKFLTSSGSMSAKTGITHETFTFRGQNLHQLIHQYGPDCRVQFHYDPHDYRVIYVADKDTGKWVQLVNSEVRDATPAYSFDLAKQRRKEKRATYKGSPMREKFMDDLVHKATAKPTKKQAKENARKDALAEVRTKQAQVRADENPIKEYSVPNPAFDTYVTADRIEKLTKHKKTDKAAK